MATPEKPTLDYSYTAFQQSLGDGTFPGTQVDNDLANLKQAIDATIDFTSAVIRSDGRLANNTVTKDALAPDVLLGIAPPVAWVTGVVYSLDQTVTINNSLYICKESHTAGTFATDLLLGRWLLICEFTVPAAIADGAVTETKHATGGVSTRALADESVETEKLLNGAVTAPKLAPTVAAALVPVGAEMPFAGTFAPAGWLLEFGQAVSRVTYAALFAALCPTAIGTVSNGSNTITGVSVDFRNLGLEGALVEGIGIPSGATVASVTATTIVLSVNATATTPSAQVRLFPHGRGDGSTTFNLPDGRDYAAVGRGNMGGVTAGRISTVGAGAPSLNTSRLGGTGGTDRHTLLAAQLAAHTHGATATVFSAGEHTHTFVGPEDPGTTPHPGGTGRFDPASIITRVTAPAGAHTHPASVTVFDNSGGEAHPNLPPSRVVNMIIFTGVV